MVKIRWIKNQKISKKKSKEVHNKSKPKTILIALK